MFPLLRRPNTVKSSLHFFKTRNLCTITPNPNLKSSLSSRLSFVFDQIDAADDQTSAKFDAVQKIRQWRENRTKDEKKSGNLKDPGTDLEDSKNTDGKMGTSEGPNENLFKNTESVELVHPWPEWIELMDRLGQQNYFYFRKISEDSVAESVGIDLSEVTEDVGFDFSRDWITVKNGCMNFGKARFDILRSLSKKDIQILVGHGCPSMDPKVVFSAKLLRKLVHLNEGDVCSSCSLRNTCSRGYILAPKEDGARTIDIMHVLLIYAFDHVNDSVTNKPLTQMKSIKTVVRKLLHEIVKLSAVPVDPNLPPPVVKKAPPKVKQPPPQPKKRVGREDLEMKKGDWLCSKCDFMNFAKNNICLQCDADRPKRQLLPGEWECPQCDFLNYRRNMACFRCDAERPPEEVTDNQSQEKQSDPRMRSVEDPGPDPTRIRAQYISKAWNFDFDDNESDGADVAAFEFADSSRGKGSAYVLDDPPHERRDSTNIGSKSSRICDGPGYFSDDDGKKAMKTSDRTGFDDFDDEEVDDYGDDDESSNNSNENYTSGSEDDLESDYKQRKTGAQNLGRKGTVGKRRGGSDSDDDLPPDSDSDSDDGMSYSCRDKLRGNNGFTNEREMNFGGNSRRELVLDGRGRNGGRRERLDKFNRRNIRRDGSNQFFDRASKGEKKDYDDKFVSRNRRRESSNQVRENEDRFSDHGKFDNGNGKPRRVIER